MLDKYSEYFLHMFEMRGLQNMKTSNLTSHFTLHNSHTTYMPTQEKNLRSLGMLKLPRQLTEKGRKINTVPIHHKLV